MATRLVPAGAILYEIKPVPGNPRQWLRQPELQQARWQLQLYADLAAHATARPWEDRPVAGAVLYLVGEDGKHATEEVDVASATGMLSRRLETILARAADRARRDARSQDLLGQFIDRDRATDRPAQQSADAELATVDSARPLLLSMPPGSGKTRLALRHGLREAFRLRLPLYWITTKARGRDEVLAELARYTAAGIPLRVVWKTVAERLCTCGLAPVDCPRHAETQTGLFFNSLPDLRSRAAWWPDDLTDYAEAHALCAHEIARELQSAADVVIADVNYLLNPSSLLRHPAVLVLDEAQNLAERIFENSRVRISREELLALAYELPAAGRRLAHGLLSAELWEVDGPDAARGQWLLLNSLLAAGHSAHPVAHAIRRAARLWSAYPIDYAVRWYRGSSPALIGTLLHADAAIHALLETDAPVIALSGSLPAEGAARDVVIPAASRFHCLEVRAAAAPPVAIVPLLEFRHPLRTEDHEAATDVLRELREHFPPTIAVFGQNRASNELLSWRLRVRGFTILLDEDLADDWSSALAAAPDFLFISLGGNLSESVNPPADLFSAAVILAPGHRAPDEFDLLRSVEWHSRAEWGGRRRSPHPRNRRPRGLAPRSGRRPCAAFARASTPRVFS